MVLMSALQYDSPQAVFDLIDRQLTLDDNALVELTKAFLAEFKLGLEKYGQPMAMM
jgi:hexokinase